MSVFTSVLENVPNFTTATEEAASDGVVNIDSAVQAMKFVEHSYCYAHVCLPKGVECADKAIAYAEASGDNKVKGYALCAKAMNLYRIGYIPKAQETAKLALAIFELVKDDEGKAEACFHLGSMIHISVGPGESPKYLQLAQEGYQQQGNATGLFLTRIQNNMLRLFSGQFAEAFADYEELLHELTGPPQQHLRCMVLFQKSNGIYIMQDTHALKLTMEEWQRQALATGNFHDYTMTKCMLTECSRIDQLDKKVMEECLDSISCCERLGSAHGYGTTAIIMGNICMDQAQYPDALFYFRKANEAALLISDIHGHHLALRGIGAALLKTGEIEEARCAFETVYEKATLLNDRINIVASLRQLAELVLQEHEYDNAVATFKTLIDTGADGLILTDYRGYADAISKASVQALNLAEISEQDRTQSQFRYLQKFLEVALQQENRREELNAYKSLADYYESIGGLSEALHHRRMHLGLYEKISAEQNMQAISRLRMEYETEKKDIEIELLKKEKIEALLLERLRISRDLHDDMGATLSSISVYSTAVKQRLKDLKYKEADTMLDAISEDARDMVSNMSDMVWMINPQNDVMSKLLDRMQLLASSVLSARDIIVHFAADESLRSSALSMDARKSIFLIFKEAVNNIAKYAVATEVSISLQQSAEGLNMTIGDDGKGYILANGHTGNGLRNMRQRADEVGGSISFASLPGQSTTVSFSCNPLN
jgi:signal transduction histidine kinase